MSTRLLQAIGWNLVTGEPSGLPHTMRKALTALEASGVGYAVSGAVALGLRGSVRTTLDLDVVVLADEVPTTLETLSSAGFEVPAVDESDLEPQYIVRDPETDVTVDVLVGFGEPEVSLIAEATVMQAAGVEARVARPEHLLISYLYSNQPRHLGDFASVAQSGQVTLAQLRGILSDTHPEMLPVLQERWDQAISPPPAPPRPTPRAE